MYSYFNDIPKGTKVARKSWKGLETFFWLQLCGFRLFMEDEDYYLIDEALPSWSMYTNSIYTYFKKGQQVIFIQYVDPDKILRPYLVPKTLFCENEDMSIWYEKISAEDFTHFKKIVSGTAVAKRRLGGEDSRRYLEEECGFTVISEDERFYYLGEAEGWSFHSIGDYFIRFYRELRYEFTEALGAKLPYLDIR